MATCKLCNTKSDRLRRFVKSEETKTNESLKLVHLLSNLFDSQPELVRLNWPFGVDRCLKGRSTQRPDLEVCAKLSE